MDIDMDRVYLFGCPRGLGPLAAAHAYVELPGIENWRNNTDFVTKSPTRLKLGAGRYAYYRDAGVDLYLGAAAGRVFVWPHELRCVWEFVKGLGGGVFRGADHRMDAYVKSIDRVPHGNEELEGIGVDLPRSLIAAHLCKAAYLDEESAVAQCLEMGMARASLEVSDQDAECLVAVDAERRGWVAFRGTESVSDAFADVDAWPVPWSETGPGRAHRGFVKMAVSVESAVREALKTMDATSVAVAGHSLGAMVALIFALRLTIEKPGP